MKTFNKYLKITIEFIVFLSFDMRFIAGRSGNSKIQVINGLRAVRISPILNTGKDKIIPVSRMNVQSQSDIFDRGGSTCLA